MSDKFGEFWFCITCGDNEERERKDFAEHLKKIHNEQETKVEGKMTLHLDLAKKAITYYECKIGKVEAQKVIVERRGGR